MRKHPLIALTAFTALGTSAIAAGTTTGTFNSVLTSSASNSSTSPAERALAQTHSNATIDRSGSHVRMVARFAPTERFSREAVSPGGRSLLAMHNPALNGWDRLEISSWSGLVTPPTPAPKPAPTPAPTPAPAPAPVVVSAPVVAPPPPAPTAPSGGAWYEIRECESGDNYAEDSGNGYYGAYQFALSTWYGLGFSGLPSQASPATQDEAAQELQARSGWGQWPQCAAELGLY